MPEPEVCPEEVFADRPKSKAKVAVAAPPVQLTSFAGVLDKLDEVILQQKKCRCVFLRAATKSKIKQSTLTDVVNFTQLLDLPDDTLSWELWNSDLGVVGDLDWAYQLDPGLLGTGEFNRLAPNQIVIRSVAGVPLFVRPQFANQVAVLEVLRL